MTLRTLFTGTKQPRELDDLREALAENLKDEEWKNSLMTEAQEISKARELAEQALRDEPTPARVEAYVQSCVDFETRAPALRRAHGLIAPKLLALRLDRTTPCVVRALRRYAENLEERIQTAIARDAETASAIGMAPVESEPVKQMRSELAAANAAIAKLSEPLGINEEAQRAGTLIAWCTKLLGVGE